jgi:tetratricopeptide (TPR) repeat protein
VTFQWIRLTWIVIVAVCVGLLPSIICGRGQPVDAEFQSALRSLEEGRTTLTDKPLSDARDSLTRLTQQHPGNALYFYHLANVARYWVEAYLARGDKKGAERALEDGINNVQRSLKLNEKSSDAHSLLADLYGRKISLGMGMFAGPRYGPKVDAENRRALELDPNNPRAFASLGRQYLESPKMFGGDIEKSIAQFRKAVELDPKSDEAFVWLAIALRKKGDGTAVDKALQEALRLNPRSVFAQHWAKQ